MVTLVPVNEKNFRKIVDMKLPPEQNKFVAPNVVSLAQAWLYYDSARPFAICNGDEIVGFIMLDMDEGERTAGVWRFMIAPEHQRRGYGRQALIAAIELARNEGKFDLVHLDYVPENSAARALYYSLGFRENGDVEDGEIVMTLPLTDSPREGSLTADEEDTEEILELVREFAEQHSLPNEFADEKALTAAIAESRVTRFTMMGETIDIALDGRRLIN